MRKSLWMMVAAGTGLLLGGGVTYIVVGRSAAPEVSAAPHAGLWDGTQSKSERASRSAEARIADLRQRVEANPESLGDWIEIGRSYREAGRYQEAADAFRRTWEIAGDQPIVLSAYGEALVLAAGGMVTPQARGILQAAVRGNPGDIKAQHYLALAEEGADNKEKALNIWVEILRNAPAGAAWAPAVRDRIIENANALGRDASLVLPKSNEPASTQQEKSEPRGPSAADIVASANMPPQDRQAMIEGMVAKLAARLEESPNDPEGWMRLSKSYSVLRKFDKAQYASSRAADLVPDNPEVLLTYARAVRAASGDESTPLYLEIMQKLIKIEPDNPEALWRLGEAAAIAGDTDKGIAMLESALQKMPTDSPDYARIKGHLTAVRLGAMKQPSR